MNSLDTAAEISSAREEQLRKMVFAGIFAAITYVVFTFLSIPIPTIAGDKVTVHLGNAFCVLGALILGSAYGGVGGALGLTIADLMDPVYIVPGQWPPLSQDFCLTRSLILRSVIFIRF